MKALIAAASGGGRAAIEFYYREKTREVKRRVRLDETEFVIALIRKAEAATNNNDNNAIVYCITSFDGSVKEANDQLLIAMTSS